MKDINISNGEYSISTEKNRIDLKAVHSFLSTEAYWCIGIPFERVQKAVENSLNFGLYHLDRQIGFARIISDYATIAYLGDVYVLPEYRGKGLSKWMMETIMTHPELQGLRRWILLTGDAHGLYRQFGWVDVASPDKWMELHNKDVYKPSL